MDQSRQDEGLASPPPAADGTARLFFALWLDAAPRAALGRLAQALHPQCGGRAVPNRNIHLTLVFLGDVEARRIPDLYTLAAGVVAPTFELAIDTVNYWRHNRIVWAAPQECPAALQTLVAALERALKAGGVGFDGRPYLPHITLLRGARRAPPVQTVDAVRWRVADFVLVRSLSYDRTTVYEVMRRWPLGTAAHSDGDHQP
jgi:2'-5' RNA ligase